jgi:hypothetical protein
VEVVIEEDERRERHPAKQTDLEAVSESVSALSAATMPSFKPR